jgi:drug/metabolite transporter (DMT)-like permease
MNLAVRIILAAALLVALIWVSRILDKKWRAKYPEEKPFVWGYFQALGFFPGGLLWFILPFTGRQTSPLLWLYIVVYGIVGSFAGYTLIKEKKKWAWMFVVIAQLNLLTWFIDCYYGRNRWKEFR